MKTAIINLYEFKELNEKAKRIAIESHREFELSIIQPSNFITGQPEYDTPEQLNEAYQIEYDYISSNDEPVIENIEANDYLFYADGKLANCTTYCGDHFKAGITELKIGNDIYRL